jgi:hypothetical protein
MFYVVEMPPQAEPRAWFAFDEDDLLDKVAARTGMAAHEVWDCSSARDLLQVLGDRPEAAGVEQRYPALCALGVSLGWDTRLYRADAVQEPGLYRRDAVDVLAACRAALVACGGEWRLYAGERHALHAVDAPDACFDRPGGWRARWLFRQQLIAVEALADDL